ncbi:MFS transporter [Xenorhabdus bovienii]|uniref:Transporter of the MFS superfamily n=1 Tax=Xenorhabdus bovienii str. kraussei Becker Underwood TaxID=1398204 RepID=A0A077PUS4_XENBV|nr:MFS transporter [Xenorhabdus bovienii]CDH23599.1 Transporter of the MFS superfamily [Xenorhabdus bovienii str. kraussei Becker Underwood]
MEHNNLSDVSKTSGKCIYQDVRRAGLREWTGLALLSLPTILLGLDLTLLHLALPVLAIDLQPTSTQALWIMDAYGFFIAGFLITMGTLGDRIGRRKLLLIGAAAFAIASVVAAFSTNAFMLIAARAALGIAGATLMPSTLALISNLFTDPRQRALGFGIWATMFGVGYALGPVMGGVLLEQFWWGAAFLIAVPVVGLLLLLGPFLLPEYRAPNSGKLDLFSVALSLAAILPIIYGIKQFAKHGVMPDTVISMAVGAVFAFLFVRRQRQLTDPLLDITLFANRIFSVALLVLLIGLVAVGGAMLLIAQYLQLVIGYSPFMAGLWMGVAALAMIVGGIVSPLVARYIRPGFVVAGSLGLSAVGYLVLTQLGNNTYDVMIAVLGLALAYLGNGTIAALGTELVVGSAPPEKAGSASAMTETVQDLGISLGIAVLGSIASAVYRDTVSSQIPDDLANNIREIVSDSLWSASSITSELPADLLTEAQTAFTTGFHTAAAISAFSIALLAILAAVTLHRIGIYDGK